MESGLALRPQDLCSDRLWGTALSCPFHVSVGQPLGKQPLDLLPPSSLACSPLWEKRCMEQLVCVSVLSGGFPPYTHTHFTVITLCLLARPAPMPPVPSLVSFSLNSWRREQVLIKCPSEEAGKN